MRAATPLKKSVSGAGPMVVVEMPAKDPEGVFSTCTTQIKMVMMIVIVEIAEAIASWLLRSRKRKTCSQLEIERASDSQRDVLTVFVVDW